MRFSISCALPAALLLGAASAVHPLAAQRLEVYATFNVTHVSDVPTGFPTPSQKTYTSLTPVGFGGGISFRVLALPLASVAVDLRGASHDGINGQDDALFGLKFSPAKPIHRVRPYLEGGAGLLSARTRNVSPSTSIFYKDDHTFTSHFAVYEFLGGLDYSFRKHIDVRLVEVGGGSSFSASPNISLATVNSGIVFNF